MQVMNGGQFEQKEVLIGQMGETEGFGVSDDPMLMSMLSTGLYANPMRTMLQEIMFNAWDAHKMVGKTDQPIEVFLSENHGLIVRDYGPGIPDEDIHPIYCIYGNSTKRGNKGQTGGFGLGSKSPFAYTESFTVTSHCDGLKNMYLISRNNDEAGGKPGRTPIITNVPTEESGLSVAVPVTKKNDLERMFDYIKDISFLSGMKIKVTCDYSRKDERTINADELLAGEFRNDGNHDNHGNIYAVYGGVRYHIPHHDLYGHEWDILSDLARLLGSFYIGFAPDTLTPMPNREGLNMNDNTAEVIHSMFEAIVENFQEQALPALRKSMDVVLKYMKDTLGIQAHFAYHSLAYLGNDNYDMEDLISEKEQRRVEVSQLKPDNNIWDTMVQLSFNHTNTVINIVGKEKFLQQRMLSYGKIYKNTEYTKLLKHQCENATIHRQMQDHVGPAIVRDLKNAIAGIEKLTGFSADPRVQFNRKNTWTKMSFTRPEKIWKLESLNISYRKRAELRNLSTFKERVEPEQEVDDRMYDKDNALYPVMVMKTIIIAKTVTALNNSSFQFQHMYAPLDSKPMQRHYSADSYWTKSSKFQSEIAPAIVVHQKDDCYDKAKAYLEENGWTVFEADEPEERVRPKAVTTDENGKKVPVKSSVPVFAQIDSQENLFEGEYITDPEAYFVCTLSKLKGYDDCPSVSNINMLTHYWPKTCILHTKARVSVVERMNVPHVSTLIKAKLDDILNQKERMRKHYLQSLFFDECDLPKEILKIPEVQKFFGVPYFRTREKDSLQEELQFIEFCKGYRRGTRSFLTYEINNLANKAFDEYDTDPSVLVIKERCRKTRIFDEYRIKDLVRKCNSDGEILMLSQKLIRLLRTI